MKNVTVSRDRIGRQIVGFKDNAHWRLYSDKTDFINARTREKPKKKADLKEPK